MGRRLVLLALLGLLALGYADKCPKQRTSPGREILCYTATSEAKLLEGTICRCTTLVHQGHDLKDLSTSGIEDFQKSLKEMNPMLQIVLSVSDEEGSLKTSARVRQEAAARIVRVLNEVDGIELNITAGTKERLVHFVQGLKTEMVRKSKDKRILLVLPTKPEDLAKQFDLKALSKYVDLFTLPTHYLVDDEEAFRTFHPSRLMGLFDMLNTDSLVDLVSGLGAAKRKILVSLPASVYKFALKKNDDNAPRAPAKGKLPVQISRSDMCKAMDEGEWVVERDEDLTAPYAFKDDTWIAFEDKISAGIKGKYVLLRDLAGLGIHNVEKDSKSKCGDSLTEEVYHSFTDNKRKTREAVLSSLQEDLQQPQSPSSGHVKSSGFRIVRVVDTDGHIHAMRENTQTEFSCPRQGYFVHPRSCNRFYRCVKFNQGVDDFSVFEFDCPAGLAFDETTEVCVWPGSISACSGSSEIAPSKDAKFTCPDHPGYYADPNNCRFFYACFDLGESELTAYEFRCPYGLVFDESKLICEWPYLVPSCGGGTYERRDYGGSGQGGSNYGGNKGYGGEGQGGHGGYGGADQGGHGGYGGGDQGHGGYGDGDQGGHGGYGGGNQGGHGGYGGGNQGGHGGYGGGDQGHGGYGDGDQGGHGGYGGGNQGGHGGYGGADQGGHGGPGEDGHSGHGGPGEDGHGGHGGPGEDGHGGHGGPGEDGHGGHGGADQGHGGYGGADQGHGGYGGADQGHGGYGGAGQDGHGGHGGSDQGGHGGYGGAGQGGHSGHGGADQGGHGGYGGAGQGGHSGHGGADQGGHGGYGGAGQGGHGGHGGVNQGGHGGAGVGEHGGYGGTGQDGHGGSSAGGHGGYGGPGQDGHGGHGGAGQDGHGGHGAAGQGGHGGYGGPGQDGHGGHGGAGQGGHGGHGGAGQGGHGGHGGAGQGGHGGYGGADQGGHGGYGGADQGGHDGHGGVDQGGHGGYGGVGQGGHGGANEGGHKGVEEDGHGGYGGADQGGHGGYGGADHGGHGGSDQGGHGGYEGADHGGHGGSDQGGLGGYEGADHGGHGGSDHGGHGGSDQDGHGGIDQDGHGGADQGGHGVYGGTTQGVYGGSTKGVYGGSTTGVYGDSGQSGHGGTTHGIYVGTTQDEYGSSTHSQHGGPTESGHTVSYTTERGYTTSHQGSYGGGGGKGSYTTSPHDGYTTIQPKYPVTSHIGYSPAPGIEIFTNADGHHDQSITVAGGSGHETNSVHDGFTTIDTGVHTGIHSGGHDGHSSTIQYGGHTRPAVTYEVEETTSHGGSATSGHSGTTTYHGNFGSTGSHGGYGGSSYTNVDSGISTGIATGSYDGSHGAEGSTTYHGHFGSSGHIAGGSTGSISSGAATQGVIETGDSTSGTVYTHGDVSGSVLGGSSEQGAILTGVTQPGYVHTQSGAPGYVVTNGVKTVYDGSASKGTYAQGVHGDGAIVTGEPAPAVVLTGHSSPGTYLVGQTSPGVVIGGEVTPGVSVSDSAHGQHYNGASGTSIYHGATGSGGQTIFTSPSKTPDYHNNPFLGQASAKVVGGGGANSVGGTYYTGGSGSSVYNGATGSRGQTTFISPSKAPDYHNNPFLAKISTIEGGAYSHGSSGSSGGGYYTGGSGTSVYNGAAGSSGQSTFTSVSKTPDYRKNPFLGHVSPTVTVSVGASSDASIGSAGGGYYTGGSGNSVYNGAAGSRGQTTFTGATSSPNLPRRPSTNDLGYKTNEYHDNGGRGTIRYNNGEVTHKFTEDDVRDHRTQFGTNPTFDVGSYEASTARQGSFTKTGPTKTGIVTAQVGGSGTYVAGSTRPRPFSSNQNIGANAFSGTSGKASSGISYGSSTTAPDLSYTTQQTDHDSASIDVSKINLGSTIDKSSSGYSYTKPAVQLNTYGVTGSTKAPILKDLASPGFSTSPAPFLDVHVYNNPSVVTSAPITASPAVVNTYTYDKTSSGQYQPTGYHQPSNLPGSSGAASTGTYSRPILNGQRKFPSVSSTLSPIAFTTGPLENFKTTVFEAARIPPSLSTVQPVIDTGYKTVVSPTPFSVGVTTNGFAYGHNNGYRTDSLSTNGNSALHINVALQPDVSSQGYYDHGDNVAPPVIGSNGYSNSISRRPSVTQSVTYQRPNVQQVTHESTGSSGYSDSSDYSDYSHSEAVGTFGQRVSQGVSVTPPVNYATPTVVIPPQIYKIPSSTIAPVIGVTYREPFQIEQSTPRPTSQSGTPFKGYSYSKPSVKFVSSTEPSISYKQESVYASQTTKSGGSPANPNIPRKEVEKLITNYDRGSAKYTPSYETYGDKSGSDYDEGSSNANGYSGQQSYATSKSSSAGKSQSGGYSSGIYSTTPSYQSFGGRVEGSLGYDSKSSLDITVKNGAVPSTTYLPISSSPSPGRRLPSSSRRPPSYSFTTPAVTTYSGSYSRPSTPSYEAPGTGLSRPKGKGKVIVKFSDLHPLLLGKLGAECTCKADPFASFRGNKPLPINSSKGRVDLRNYDESDVYVDLEASKEDGDYDSAEYNTYIEGSTTANYDSGRYETPVVAVFNGVTPSTRKTSKPRRPSANYQSSSSTYLPPVSSTGRPPSSTYLPAPSSTKQPSSSTYLPPSSTYLPSAETSLRGGVKASFRTGKNLKDSSSTNANSLNGQGAPYDRYGPGALRDLDETLQGTSDCARPGLFRHPNFCNKFYACHWDEWKKKFTLHVFNCPIHLTFDNGAGACNWPSKGPACQDDNLLV